MLELGCGAGANIPFFVALQFDYFAIEGSPSIASLLKKKFPDLASKIIVGDFTDNFPFKEKFDLVIDRASITHNDTQSIKKTLNLILQSLKPGGLFIGSDWFSTNHSDYLKGTKVKDDFTRSNFLQGQFSGVGLVHFSNETHIHELFSAFELLTLEEKMIVRLEPTDNHVFASYNIVARLPLAK